MSISGSQFSPPTTLMTNTIRLEEGGPAHLKPTAFESFVRGLKKFGSFFANIAGSVLRFLPFPGARIAAAGLYGLGNLAQSSLQADYAKQANEMSLHAARNQGGGMNVITPGFGMGTPPKLDFNVPAGNPMQQEKKWQTIENRESAMHYNIDNLVVSS